jgi:osmoprotectant transport system substrate-binding protein
MRSLRTFLTILSVALITVNAATGCFSSSGGATAKPGSLAEIGTLTGATFTVGSKEFTEQLILCHITSLALRSTPATRTALTSGNIDMYWEYTGTAWLAHFEHDAPIGNPAKQYDAVAQEDLAKNSIRWGTRAPANNTYAIAVNASTGQQLGVATISDYARLVQTNPAKASMCVASEFMGRPDGLPGLEKAYGFTVPPNELKIIAEGAFYTSVANGDPCVFSEAGTTDGRISNLGLTILTDDKNFFPIYNPALTVRESICKNHPDLLKIIEPIALALTDEELQHLNGDVDIKGEVHTTVAQNWLQAKGFIGK